MTPQWFSILLFYKRFEYGSGIMCAPTGRNDYLQQKFYVEGYIKEIKVEKETSNEKMSAKFTFSSDWQGKDSKLLYGILSSNDTSDEIKSYCTYVQTDLFYTDYYADCLAPRLPLHLGIYFEKNKDHDCEFLVTAFRVIYEY